MIKAYCDRCKRMIPSDKNGFIMTRYQNIKGEKPNVGDYRGSVDEACESLYANDDGTKDTYYKGMMLCANCQKELDLLVTDYMGIKKRR